MVLAFMQHSKSFQVVPYSLGSGRVSDGSGFSSASDASQSILPETAGFRASCFVSPSVRANTAHLNSQGLIMVLAFMQKSRKGFQLLQFCSGAVGTRTVLESLQRRWPHRRYLPKPQDFVLRVSSFGVSGSNLLRVQGVGVRGTKS